MKLFDWDEEKNKRLKRDRGISFEEVVFYIANGFVLDIVLHPNQNKYPNQKMFIVNIDNYAYLVPFIENNEIIYLKTIIPSRKATKKYLRRR
ncbi:MAG: BrnT family toxin [Candidatus Omnitrophica bacterium]|nr:BrnT family toxin [Candidatus Omnitrophota bacterium]